MGFVTHIFLLLIAVAVIWFFAGMIIDGVNRLAHKFHKNSFLIAFFVLGLLTSIGEISVASNSLVQSVPQVSAGNLVGASFVLLLLVIPLLAFGTRGLKIKRVLDNPKLIFTLITIGLPSFFFLDGIFSRQEGVASLLLYGILIYIIRKHIADNHLERQGEHIHTKYLIREVGKIIIGSGLIFMAGHLIVNEAIYFAELFHVSQSLIGIVALSIGTNIPEIAIAIRSIAKKKTGIALGDYLGSASMNTFIIGMLGIIGGPFSIDKQSFMILFYFIVFGFILFYIFIRSKETMSRKEGGILLGLYLLFVIIQIYLVI